MSMPARFAAACGRWAFEDGMCRQCKKDAPREATALKSETPTPTATPPELPAPMAAPTAPLMPWTRRGFTSVPARDASSQHMVTARAATCDTVNGGRASDRLVHHRIALDHMFDVQGWGHPGTIRSCGFSNVCTNRAPNGYRLGESWYAERKATKCYLAFFHAASGQALSMGCFTPDGKLESVIHERCEISNIHEDAVMYIGDGRWGTIVMAMHARDEMVATGRCHLTRCAPSSATALREWLRKNEGSAQYWRMIREHVRARSIFFYWLDLTQHLMVEGGARQLADLQEFESDFARRGA